MSIKERFNLLREVSSAFSFLYTRDKLLLVQQENALLTCCKEFQKKFGDIDSDEMSAELQRFVLILQKKRNLNTAQAVAARDQNTRGCCTGEPFYSKRILLLL